MAKPSGVGVLVRILAVLCAAAASAAAQPVQEPARPLAVAPGPAHPSPLLPWLASESGSNPSLSLGCSTYYCLQQATLNAAGHPVLGLSCAMNASLGQELATGCSSSLRYVLQSGFWGAYGTTLVPVVLLVRKAVADPDWPELYWSGNNEPYTIYRATTCSQIFSSFHDRTSLKTYVDEMPPASDLTCYNVLATAPGRSGEPFSPEYNGSATTADGSH